jgi:hypothetical protein
MPYFKREPVHALPRSNLAVLSKLTRATPTRALDEQMTDATSIQTIVARASGVLDRAMGKAKTESLPWTWHSRSDPGGTPAERLQDAANAFLSSFGLPVLGATSTAETPTANGRSGVDDVPALRTEVVAAGSHAHVLLRIANDEIESATVSFVSTPLVATTGDSLGLQSLSFSPPQLTVPGGREAAVEIRIAVPESTRAGKYAGLVMSTGSEPIRAVVTVQVT